MVKELLLQEVGDVELWLTFRWHTLAEITYCEVGLL